MDEQEQGEPTAEMTDKAEAPSIETKLVETPWLTVLEVAAYLSVSAGTVRNWVSQRRIPFARRGRVVRFHREKIDRWLSAGECAGRLRARRRSVSGGRMVEESLESRICRADE